MWKNIKKKFDSNESYISLALGLAVVLMLGTLVYNYFTKRPGAPPEETKSDAQKEETKMSLPTKHTVGAGESLWMISEKYYKSGYNWVDIQKANNLASADGIEVGQTLEIPQVTPIVPTATIMATATPVVTAEGGTGSTGQVSGMSTEAAPTKKTYTVLKGDYLWKIALKEYKDGYKWVDIAKANNLPNPDLIYPGTVLTLP